MTVKLSKMICQLVMVLFPGRVFHSCWLFNLEFCSLIHPFNNQYIFLHNLWTEVQEEVNAEMFAKLRDHGKKMAEKIYAIADKHMLKVQAHPGHHYEAQAEHIQNSVMIRIEAISVFILGLELLALASQPTSKVGMSNPMASYFRSWPCQDAAAAKKDKKQKQRPQKKEKQTAESRKNEKSEKGRKGEKGGTGEKGGKGAKGGRTKKGDGKGKKIPLPPSSESTPAKKMKARSPDQKGWKASPMAVKQQADFRQKTALDTLKELHIKMKGVEGFWAPDLETFERKTLGINDGLDGLVIQ